MKSAVRKKMAKNLLLAATLLWTLSSCATCPAPFFPQKAEERPAKKVKPEPAVEAAPVPGAKPARPAGVAPEPQKPIPARYVHTVRWPGETLSLIAQWYTGSWKNWTALADANPGINPDRITIGDKIRIPDDLLKTREPLPREFLSPQEGESEPESPAPEQPEKPAGDLELFGPKG